MSRTARPADAPLATPSAIRAAFERLARAGRELRRRPAREVLARLGAVLDAWRHEASPWRHELAERLPEVTGFSPATVREGLARGLAPYSAEALERLVERELGGIERLDAPRGARVSGFETTALLLAGALPTPTFPALLAPLLLRSAVLVKTSSHDPLTARLLAASIAGCDPGLGACVEVVGFAGDDAACASAFFEAPCLVATGSDETVTAVAARVRPPRRLVARGHRLSVAALGPGSTRAAELDAAARALALDVALWDQLGCLSPLAVYVADADPRAPDRVAEALAGALAEAEERWPRGRIDAPAAAAVARERAEAEMRAASGARTALYAGSGTSWTVVREADARMRPAPLHRFVRVHPVADPASLADALRALAPHLAGVALAGFARETQPLAHALAGLGASRVCAIGTLQTPPLDWPQDNQGVLTPLTRWSGLELPER